MSEIPKNTVFFMLGKVVLAVVGIIVTTFIARSLGPEKYGVLSLADSLMVIFMVLSQLGLHATSTYLIAKNSKDKEKLKGIINYVLKISVLSAGVFSLMLAFSSGLLSSYYSMPLLAVALPFFAASAFFSNIELLLQGIFNGFKKLYYYFLMDLAHGLSKGFALLFVLLGFGIAGASFGYSLSVFVPVAAGFVFLFSSFYPKGVKPRISGSDISAVWKYSIPIYSLTVLERINVQIQNVLLGFISSIEVSYFHIAAVVSAFFVIFGQAISQSLFPEISEAKEEKSVLRKIHFSNKYLAVYAFFAGPLLILMRKSIILTVFGQEYLGAETAFSAVVFANMIYLLGFIGYAVLLGQNKPAKVFKAIFTQFIANTLLCAFLIPQFQSLGAGIALAFSTFISTSIFFISSKKVINFKYPVSETARIIISSIIMSAVVFYISSSIHLGLFEIVVDTGAGIAVYLACLLALKVIKKEDIEIAKNLSKIFVP